MLPGIRVVQLVILLCSIRHWKRQAKPKCCRCCQSIETTCLSLKNLTDCGKSKLQVIRGEHDFPWSSIESFVVHSQVYGASERFPLLGCKLVYTAQSHFIFSSTQLLEQVQKEMITYRGCHVNMFLPVLSIYTENLGNLSKMAKTWKVYHDHAMQLKSWQDLGNFAMIRLTGLSKIHQLKNNVTCQLAIIHWMYQFSFIFPSV